MDWIFFIFINIGIFCGDRANQSMVVLWVPHLILAKIFLRWEKAKHVWLEGRLEFVWKLCSIIFTLVLSWLVMKKKKKKKRRTFWIYISNIFIHYLPYKKLRHSYESDWLTRIIVNHGLDLTNKFRSSFLIRTIRVMLPCSSNSFLNTLHCHLNTEIFVLALRA